MYKYLSETHTPPAIRYHICNGLFSWIEAGRYHLPQMPPPTMDKSLETTLRTQNNIGWEHFMRGHMTIKWGHLISQHISTQPQHKIAAKKWGAKPIAINWKYILQLWQQRSEELHGISTEQTEQSHQ
jgi:hypothetical protein